jgi:hypothetical protein
MSHNQATAMFAQRSIELDQAAMNDGDTAITLAMLPQWIETVLVKNESSIQCPAALQRMMERCMIKIA